MKINEIAQKLNISTRAIRFYEEKGLIAPRHAENQYRHFSEQDVWRLQTIIALREVGMTLDDIAKALNHVDSGNKDLLLDYLELQRSVMYAQWVEMKQILFTTDQMIDLLKTNQSIDMADIFQLADGSKRLREARSAWYDRWNYDHRAESHDDRVRPKAEEFSIYRDYEETLELLVRLIGPRPGEYGLDLGTGTGNLAGLFLHQGIRMAAVDQSREMLRHCQRKFPSLTAKLGNLLSIPFLDHQFDFLVTSFALHHLTDEQKTVAVAEMKRVLVPHGRICIADLMFADHEKREAYFEGMLRDGKLEQHALLSEFHFTNLSVFLPLLEQHGYLYKHQQINELLHVVYAVPMR
ncbi:UNVERIFIED_CONTAM: putative AdoMet-dependent methyltransferase [Brevibacillus sp. OAP136]